MYIIVTNHVNWHRENLQSDRKNRENTGNLKLKFEWVPCNILPQLNGEDEFNELIVVSIT